MDYTIDTSDNCATVKIQGVLTFDDHEKFKGVVQSISTEQAEEIVINLAETKMIDSAGIGMLLLANDKAMKAGKTVKLAGVSGHVAKVVELSKIDQLIPVI
ncbi:MAG: STAS domain-containing protein [Maricaulis sp.]|jgi:anti-anti-sigma factor|nr:STAS domain-containing protein [Maricaulis sp.]MDG2044684.1 STAS domain-containing protein [Maricaulis sp.]